jgi:hypothetical protein
MDWQKKNIPWSHLQKVSDRFGVFLYQIAFLLWVAAGTMGVEDFGGGQTRRGRDLARWRS